MVKLHDYRGAAGGLAWVCIVPFVCCFCTAVLFCMVFCMAYCTVVAAFSTVPFVLSLRLPSNGRPSLAFLRLPCPCSYLVHVHAPLTTVRVAAAKKGGRKSEHFLF